MADCSPWQLSLLFYQLPCLTDFCYIFVIINRKPQLLKLMLFGKSLWLWESYCMGSKFNFKPMFEQKLPDRLQKQGLLGNIFKDSCSRIAVN